MQLVIQEKPMTSLQVVGKKLLMHDELYGKPKETRSQITWMGIAHMFLRIAQVGMMGVNHVGMGVVHV